MTFSAALLALTGGALPFIVSVAYRGAAEARWAMLLIVGGFWLRMFACALVSQLSFFSHAGGGDCGAYLIFGDYVVKSWRSEGLYFATVDTHPELAEVLGSATLFVNFIAFIGYIDGEMNRFGAVSIIAFATALTAINMHKTAIAFGAPPRRALLAVGLFYLSPGLLFHTSDTYKDGFVLFFTTNALLGVFRVSRRFSLAWLLAVAASLTGLWYTRFYFVYMTIAPLSVSLLGLRSKSMLRILSGVVVLSVAAILGLAYLGKNLASFQERAAQTYESATSVEVRDWNEKGGSGVDFDDGGDPFAKLPQKIAYTLLSPFPWTGGSFGLQVGKFDALLIYYLLYRSFFSAKRLLRDDPPLLFMFLVFIVPSVVAYAMTMANIGLILRQRLPIIAILTVLACVGWETDLAGAREKKRKLPPQHAILERLRTPAE
ncbi:MAG: hypothetical protein IT374_04405 [Polyangiaceae bacterium]|nr:hypothetical protein [Polyangiaceae bacterium]